MYGLSPYIILLTFCMSGCKVSEKQLIGHWWVIEKSAGYIEFSINDNQMVVCSHNLGMIYSGRIEVKNLKLIQYEMNDSNQVRLIGEILHLSEDTLILKYDENIEKCVRLSDTIPEMDEKNCFAGFSTRKKH